MKIVITINICESEKEYEGEISKQRISSFLRNPRTMDVIESIKLGETRMLLDSSGDVVGSVQAIQND